MDLKRRFTIGDTVRIRDVILTRHVGLAGEIIHVAPNRLGRSTLDKYTVRFSEGDEAEFWGIQLERIAADVGVTNP